ncbi:MAG: prepilin-type cleavage/methylation domain-containing protein [Candidatus Accumulibacter sp.]|jgi:type II secretory pathway pseudopilin PulG|nr:prepilin-type cleavage/methylation domain-containing protein [Accumulibacter sp.]
MNAYRRGGAGPALEAGFSLLEIAVVLGVAAIILGSVITAGRGVQRNAENSRIAQKFVFEWKRVYDEYFQRAGVVVGDSQIAPTFMINGSETEIGGQSVGRGNLAGNVAGVPENYRNTGLKVCHGQGYPRDSVGPGDRGLARQDLRDLMLKAGLRMPAGRAEGMEDRAVYNDSNSNATEVQVCFQWNPPGTISGAGNVMVLRGLTPDLARYLDSLIDGKADALEGLFRQQDVRMNTSEPSSQRPGREWSANNTFGVGEAQFQSAETTGGNRNEDRVVLMTAHWAMNQ